MSEETTNIQPSTPSSMTLILTLGIIAMVSGLLVVLTDQLTKDRIARLEKEALERAITSVLPEAVTSQSYQLNEDGLLLLEDGQSADAEKNTLYAGYDANGKLSGLAMISSARGYAGIVKVLYGYNPESQCVIGFTVLQSTETPGLGDKIEKDPNFLANFECLDASLSEDGSKIANVIETVKNGNKDNPWQIDGISGATVTSKALGTGLGESTSRMLPLLNKYRDSLPLQLEQ
ncbi:MAG: RnfABCDGE type electron transport complex subunit G [Puniceicoccaceae bacterium]